jgi:hypothetical protein
MNSNRQRGLVLLHLLDLNKELDEAFKRYMELRPDQTDEGWTGFNASQDRLAVGQARDGKWYVVGTEGVGWEVSESQNLTVDVFLTQGPDGTKFSMFPNATAHMTLAEVLASRTEEVIDLADLVRVFGDRLEVNFGIWVHKFTSIADDDGRGVY